MMQVAVLGPVRYLQLLLATLTVWHASAFTNNYTRLYFNNESSPLSYYPRCLNLSLRTFVCYSHAHPNVLFEILIGQHPAFVIAYAAY